MVISIVIPVLNEELYLPSLLELIANQTFKDFEVIIVDGVSTDNTIKVAESFKSKIDLKIVKAPHKGVSFQRNLGAKNAKSDLLLFMDADVSFDKNFLQNVVNEFDSKSFDIGTVKSLPKDKNIIDEILSFLYGIYQNITKDFAPEIYGWMILVKKDMHQKISGFDEKLYFSEDSDYAKRVVKNKGKFQILKSIKIYFSARRIKKEGRGAFEIKMIKYFLYLKLYGKYIAQEKITYKSGQFTN